MTDGAARTITEMEELLSVLTKGDAILFERARRRLEGGIQALNGRG